MKARIWTYLGLLGLLLLGRESAGQVYFNRRLPFSPGVSGATAVLPIPGGYVVSGFCGEPNGDGAFSAQVLDAAGRPTRPAYKESRAGWQVVPWWHSSLKSTAEGGFVVAGMAYANGQTAGATGRLWRFSARGDTLWSRTYQAAPGDGMSFLTVCRLPNGGYALGGIYYPLTTGVGSGNYLLVVTDSSGHERWRRTYNVGQEDFLEDVLATPDGGFLLTGWTAPNALSETDGAVVKVDSLGRRQWTTTFGRRYTFDYACGALARPEGGYVVAGSLEESPSTGPAVRQPALFWLDSAGTIQRQRCYGPRFPKSETLSLAAVPGGYLLGGIQNDTTGRGRGPTVTQGFGLKVCADSDSSWYRVYRYYLGRWSWNSLYDLRPTPDGGFVGAGLTLPNPPDTAAVQSMWVFKTDQYGYLQPGGAPPTVQCRPTGLPQEATGVGLELWPNPSADGRFTLRLPQTGATMLTVTDALGRVVWRGASTGGAETGGDLSASAPGLYVLRVQDARGRQRTYKLLRQ